MIDAIVALSGVSRNFFEQQLGRAQRRRIRPQHALVGETPATEPHLYDAALLIFECLKKDSPGNY